MPTGVFALLNRSLRIDARGWSTHLARLGLLISIYFALCFALSQQQRFGAPGLRFFQGIAYLDLTFMTLLGIGFFSTVITEEKEEDTLGLMLMAGISPLGILLGKIGGRLWQAILLIAVRYPFLQLAVTMGGVTAHQIWTVTLSLLAYMLLLAGFGLLCSTIAPRSRTAGSLMIVGLAIYFLVPTIARAILQYGALGRPMPGTPMLPFEIWLLECIGDLGVAQRISDILATGFSDSAVGAQAITSTLAGVFCAALSWLLFGIAAHHPSSEFSGRGAVALTRGFFRFNAGRPWRDPFIWKDFHFASGGFGMILIRFAYYMVFVVVVILLKELRDPRDGWIEFCLMMMSLSVSIDAALLVARSIHDEICGQTLASLIMLPRSSIQVMYSKFAGALLVWLSGPLLELLLTLYVPSGRDNLWSLLKNEQGGWAVVMLFVLVPHFAALAAVYVRWGAVPIGICLTIGVYFLIIAAITMTTGGGYPGDIFFGIIAFLMLGLCAGCHLSVLLRVQALVAK